tara:strand:+ start:2232 stop:3674 length:1443 start_codon:yes stop_codon:yes gene_type:complete
MADITGIQYFEITPTNKKDVYSFRQGGGAITFKFEGNPSLLLDLSTLRLNYRMRIVSGATAFNSDPAGAGQGRPQNASTLGAFGGTTASISAPVEILNNCRVGSASLIDTITLTNLNGAVMEQVRNYPRKEATILPLTRGMDDYTSYMNYTNGATAKNMSQQLTCNGDIECSMPLRTGLLQTGADLPLGNIGGLIMELRLNSDQNVLFGGNAGDNGGAYYMLYDLCLTGRYKVASKPLSPQKVPLQYSAYQSINSLIQTNDETTNFNLAESNALTLWNNIINSSNLNNYSTDSYATPPILKVTADTTSHKEFITDLTFNRQGAKYPLEYQIEERDIVEQLSYTAQYINYMPMDTLRLRSWLDAVVPFDRLNHALICPASENTGLADADRQTSFVLFGDQRQNLASAAQVLQGRMDAQAQGIYGFGVRVDRTNSNRGMNYDNASYSQRVRSKLSTSQNEMVYSFVLGTHQLVASPQGVMVN